MEWWKYYYVLHFTVTTAELMMLHVLRCLGSLCSYESLLKTFVSFAAVTLSYFQNFPVDISKVYLV